MFAAGSSRSSLATVLRESPKCWAAARWLLPWIKTQVRISSRSATGYTFLFLRSLEMSFEYSGLLGPVAHFCISEWLTLRIAFTTRTLDETKDFIRGQSHRWESAQYI